MVLYLRHSKNRTPHSKIPLAAFEMEQKPKTASKNREPLIKKAKNRKPSGFEKPRAAYKFRQKPKTAARNRKPHFKMNINRTTPSPTQSRLRASIMAGWGLEKLEEGQCGRGGGFEK